MVNRIPIVVFLATCAVDPNLLVSARADDNLRLEMRVVATSIRALSEADQPAVVDLVGFADRPSEDSRLRPASGAGVALTLAQELHRQGIGVKRGAPFRLSGTVTDVIDAKTKLLSAQVKGAAVDLEGKERHAFSRGVFGDAVLSAFWGLTLDLAPTDDHLARSEQMIAAIDKPTLRVEKTAVRSSAKSPFAMELLVRDGRVFRPATPVERRGEAVVAMRRDDVFSVRLHNDSDHEAAVLLFINAVPLFAFNEAGQYQQVVLPPRGTGVVRGWFLGGKPLFRAFRPFDYPPNEALPEFPEPSGLGVVTAVFSRSWKRDESPPDDEPPSAKVRMQSRSAGATGRELLLKNDHLKADLSPDKPAEEFAPANDPVAADFRSEFYNVDREFGVVRAAVSIRFETPAK